MPSEKIISIGLPVKDEEDSLPRTLKRLLEQNTPGYKKEIIVCLNGSNQATTKIAREFAARNPEIVLIEEPRAGKSRAWNLIRARAKSDIIVFCDADVEFEDNAIINLFKGLEKRKDIDVLGGRMFPRTANEKGFLRRPIDVITAYSAKFPKMKRIVGSLYAIKKNSLKEIPQEILHEDTYINAVLAKRLDVLENVQVIHTPVKNFGEFIREQERLHSAVLQLREMFPEADPKMARRKPELSLLKYLNWYEKAHLPLYFGLRFIGKKIAEAKFKKRKGKVPRTWKKLKSTALPRKREGIRI